MFDASLEYGIRQTGSGRIGRKTGGEPIPAEITGNRDMRATVCQSVVQLAVITGQNPHGVESAPTAEQGTTSELGNFAAISFVEWQQMIEATGDHHREGRNLRSSPRTGKPSTWRREIVGKAFQQEMGI